MANLIVITGPTAVGKTDLCIRLAHLFSAPIVNADSRQVYREMKIGTARPDEAELAQARFYFVGNLSITDYYSAARYEQDALRLLAELFRTSDYVILSGGSMMYVDAVVKGIDDIPTVPDDIRAEMKQRLESEGLEALGDELKRLDPEYHAIVDLKNPRRVLHALEICHSTGRTYTSFRVRACKPRPFNIIKIGLNIPRPRLFERINGRVDKMIAEGLVDEARELYPQRGLTALNTVGYNEMFKYFDGEMTLPVAIERMKKNTRVYAKKQLTWYKRDEEMTWFGPDDFDSIVEYIKSKSVPAVR
ncbi:MAG: tRNA (adenosine(37)-N6)-dimethylallyltransferase MiaA [Prevotellaceae bacterium]|nr:tRNA (adenosine(37)-N6)-dimethylallyltransferase MiaA [Prevotellaceae bacterium]PWL80092.1 MAG: tRNA (adenosine(37)-N6)-dimethylallyltransferase MiaA [Prevotellaceae bacterium]